MKTKTFRVKAEIKKLLDDDGKAKAIASLTIDDVFVVCGVRLIDGYNGLFISMPSKRNLDGEYVNICFPINNETRLQIQNEVISAYEEALSEQKKIDDEAESAGDSPMSDEENAQEAV